MIDLAKYPVGTRLTVGDLDIAKEGKLEIKTPLTDTVLHVTAHQHGKAAEVDEPEAPAEKELVTPATKEAAALAAKENK